MVEVEGLRAQLDGETLVLFIASDGEEKIVMAALELAEALARLEEEPPMYTRGASDESEDLPQEPVVDEGQPSPWGPHFAYKQPSEGGYRAAEAYVIEPSGMLLLRRVFSEGEDLLEFDTPVGATYEFAYRETLEYLRQFLPH